MSVQTTRGTALGALITDGVAITVFQAEQAMHLEDLVGREATRIDAAGFGGFFGNLQIILGRYIVLTAAQLFEKPNQRYPTQSVPTAIRFLDEHADALVVEQRPGLLRSLSKLGAPVQDIEEASDPELTRFVAHFFHEQVAQVDVGEVLTTLKTLRDKAVAHFETVPNDLPKPTCADIKRLVALAQSFVEVVALGYLSRSYAGDGGSSDAQRATISLRRLLQQAGVLPDRDS